MQQDLLAALKKAVWKEATCSNNSVTTVVNKVTQTDGKQAEDGTVTQEPTYTTYLDNRFDAFKQGGDANPSTASFCGYAGMVAYRFKLPTNYSSDISEVGVMLQSSRYLRSGLRVCLVLSNTATPSTDWNTVRGDNANAIVSEHDSADCPEGVSSWGVLSQQVSTLLETRPQEQTVVFNSSDFPALGTSTRYQYLFVYVSLEDYCDYWTMYSMTEPRYYSIEGSAILVGSACTVSFVGAETLVPLTQTMDIVKGGVLPSVWSDGAKESLGSEVNYVTVQRNGDPLNDGNLQMTISEIEKNGGVINRVDVLPPIGSRYNPDGGVTQFACICGKGFKGTFPNLDGLLLYDCEAKRLIGKSTTALPMTPTSIYALNDETYHYGIVRCLMGYYNGKGFYFLPCVGNHVPANRFVDQYDYYHYDMLQEQVDGVYPSSAQNEFYFFGYDKDNNVLTNVRVERHGYWRLRGTDHNSGALMALPGMAVDTVGYSGTGNKTLLWMGVCRGRVVSDTQLYIEPLLVEDMQGVDVYANGNEFRIEAYRRNGGVLKDLVTVPVSTYRPNSAITKDYRSGIGVQVVGGQFYFSGTVYDDQYQRNYSSTATVDSSLKILVLYKVSGASVAKGIFVLDSSIEKAGIQFNETAQVTHTSWSVKNNVIAEPEHGNEFMVTDLDTTAIKVYETFEKRVTGYPREAKWVQEFDNGNAMWCTSDNVSSSVFRGSYVIYNDEYSLASSAEGLRVCYGRFFNGEAKPLNGLTKRVGAACTLVGSTQVSIQESQTTETLGCWQIVQSSLIVPFGCPRTWKAKQIKLDWNRWTGRGTAGSMIYVWLVRGQFIVKAPDYLGKFPISTGGTVPGCELVGQIDPTSATKVATFNIQDLSSPTATIILTAFIDMDAINPSASMTFPKGVGSLSLDMSSMELSGTETCFIPDIYLLG